MRRLWWWLLLLVPVAAFADPTIFAQEVRILNVGLDGYVGVTTPITLRVHNPSPTPQTIHLDLRLTSDLNHEVVAVGDADVFLQGDERRTVELPMAMQVGRSSLKVLASAGGTPIGQDFASDIQLRNNKVVAMLCGDAAICKEVQQQAQFSGTVEDRADKNRQLSFEAIDDFRDHGWAYSPADVVVVALPLKRLTEPQKRALEDYLRLGGRLVLLETEAADPNFLAPYRADQAAKGALVGRGRLFRVASLGAKKLGDVFASDSLHAILNDSIPGIRFNAYQQDWLTLRYASKFDFPRLKWVLLWLAAYILVIGLVNFAVLRRLRRLEYGWLTACAVALLFAAGLYVSGTSHRPKQFRLDKLAIYAMDDRSALAAAEYELRVSSPARRDVRVAVGDDAVFTQGSLARDRESNSRVWEDINREGPRGSREMYDVHLGTPSWVELSLLKWSYHDLHLQGLRKFAGTVHFVAPGRLRNDTGETFEEAIYVDFDQDKIYEIPNLAAGAEVDLNRLRSSPASFKDPRDRVMYYSSRDPGNETLKTAVRGYSVTLKAVQRLFVGLTDGPNLQAELNVPAEQRTKSLVLVGMELKP